MDDNEYLKDLMKRFSDDQEDPEIEEGQRALLYKLFNTEEQKKQLMNKMEMAEKDANDLLEKLDKAKMNLDELRRNMEFLMARANTFAEAILAISE